MRCTSDVEESLGFIHWIMVIFLRKPVKNALCNRSCILIPHSISDLLGFILTCHLFLKNNILENQGIILLILLRPSDNILNILIENNLVKYNNIFYN